MQPDHGSVWRYPPRAGTPKSFDLPLRTPALRLPKKICARWRAKEGAASDVETVSGR